MSKRRIRSMGLGVLFAVLFSFGLSWAQSPPTLLVVVRASDDSLWKMTCDEVGCTAFSSFPGMFRYQPTVAWDETAQEWVLIGTASDNSIWKSTFDKQGNFNNDWQSLPGLTPSPAGAAGGPLIPATITVTCPGQSLQAAVNAAQTGATINVTGTCTENVIIAEEKQRLTLNGQSGAILQATSATDNVLNIRGRGIVINNFEIKGGNQGIWVNRGSTAVINGNNIHNNGQHGILVMQSSSAVITNNNIHDNSQHGIIVLENSTARIGYTYSTDASPSSNTIQNNGSRGIDVDHASSARIVGNIIANNTNDGIGVFRSSQADIADNTINNNGRGIVPVGHGINVVYNGGINLGESDASTFIGQPNITTVNNAGYGINCSLGGYVRAYHFVQTYDATHPIWGDSGQYSFTGTCPNTLTNP